MREGGEGYEEGAEGGEKGRGYVMGVEEGGAAR